MLRLKTVLLTLFLALLITAFCLSLGSADQPAQRPSNSWNVEQGIELPIGKTQWEMENEHLFPVIYPTDDPPPPPVVQCAEWESMSGVLIRYPLGISTDIIREMAEDVVVTTIVSSYSQQQSVYSQYESAGVNMANTDWLIAPSNSIWTRDYGPWFLFTGDDVQGITDHIYNRPTRPDDNNIPWVFGAEFGIPVYGMSLTHSGGNFMCDGMGVAMSTNLVYDENSGLNQEQVDNLIFEYTGNDYIVVPDILSGGIHHIDCWAKMIDPGRILVKRLDPPNTQLEANVAYYESLISSYGEPYEIIRVDCESSTPYTNSLIMNNKVLVPLFGSYLDDQAMQTYEQAMPGYEIIGVYGSWVSDDAIHCRAMGIADRYMLRIVHVPLPDQENTGMGYLVEADVHAYSNQPLLAGMPQIKWKVGAGSYNTVTMTPQGGDLYAGYIPEQLNYSTVYYYLHAEDASGRRENHPYIGAGNPHHFTVAPDTIPPAIVHNPWSDLSIYEWPPTITAMVTDNTGIDQVYVEYTINGVPQANVNLTPVGNVYSGQLTGTVVMGDTYEYRIVAVDASASGNVAYAPASGMYGGTIVPAFLSDMEDGAPDWTHSVVLPGFGDQWHISTRRNHTTGGSQSYKCGDTGSGSYADLLDAGLVTPQYTVTNGVRLTFWHWIAAEVSTSYPGYAYDGGLVEMSLDGGDWTQITPVGGYPYLVRTGGTPGPFAAETPIFSGSYGEWQQASFEAPWIAGSVQFRFRFGSDGATAAEGWYIDDALVVIYGAGTSPLEVVLTPETLPIVIPSTGGSFNYNIAVSNTGSTPATADIWCDITLPNGRPYGPTLGPVLNFTLPGNWSTNRNRTQTIPTGAPVGDYTYNGYIGVYPSIIFNQDSFPFSKSGDDGTGNWYEGWENYGEEFTAAGVASTIIPERFALYPAYPNPFNPLTMLGFTLPQAAQVNLSVYDVTGKRVAELVNGWRQVGSHEVTFDASGLASGMYLYRLETEGFSATGKLLLVK
ncbi:MAG: agmatine deiminase family protein [bacterium]